MQKTAKRSPRRNPTTASLRRLADRRLQAILAAAQAMPGLVRRVPRPSGRGPRPAWEASVQLVGAAAMTRLNGEYRGKRYPTDVLSFNAPEVVLAATGQLGELVICVPTLRRQARERGHRDAVELEVLLVHGVLHLLGFDHELGEREAREMARWEARLLPAAEGLIGRSG